MAMTDVQLALRGYFHPMLTAKPLYANPCGARPPRKANPGRPRGPYGMVGKAMPTTPTTSPLPPPPPPCHPPPAPPAPVLFDLGTPKASPGPLHLGTPKAAAMSPPHTPAPKPSKAARVKAMPSSLVPPGDPKHGRISPFECVWSIRGPEPPKEWIGPDPRVSWLKFFVQHVWIHIFYTYVCITSTFVFVFRLYTYQLLTNNLLCNYFHNMFIPNLDDG